MLANCSNCGKLISSSLPGALCPECAQEKEREYQAVKDYLYKKPNAKVDEVVRETGISLKLVREFWEGGRLMRDSQVGDGQKVCGRCGTPIFAGSLCVRCSGGSNSR